MIIKPSNMSRRGFLQGVLGVATTIILPQRSLSYNSLDYDWRAEAIRLNDDLRKADGLMAGMNEFMRVKLREDGFYRRILPPLPIQNDMLDRCVPMPPLPGGRMVNGVWRVDPRVVKRKVFTLEDVRI